MRPSEYQRLAARTECDQTKALARIGGIFAVPTAETLQAVRFNHAALGLLGEVGELSGSVEKWLYYGQKRDDTNIIEELGDCLWYIALACNALNLDLGAVMEANIRKLQARYPEKYRDDLAAEEHRDRSKEMAAVVQDGHGFGHIEDEE